MRIVPGFLLAAIILPGLSSPLLSQSPTEEILAFDVRIDVGPGGTMRVTESIRVQAAGQEIQHGIYRDFPTTFPRSALGGEVVAPFTVLLVARDGEPERYRIERILGPSGRGGVRVRVGDPDVFLTERVYDYTLVYETERWMAFGETDDELSWNVTGNGWSFPIRSASAEVLLPSAVPLEDVTLEAWTGPEGSTDSDASWEWAADTNRAVFETTAPLGAFEGLTVAIRLPRGVVQPPSSEQERAWFRLDWGGYVEASIGVALILGLYLLMWFRVGRDPPSRSVVVSYDPPDGFSPAALGFLRERGYDEAQLNAAIVSLAVKGAVTIEKDGYRWRIRPTGTLPEDLTRDERRLYKKLVGRGDVLTLSGASSPRLRKAVKDLRKALEQQIETRYFVTNRGWFIAGASVSLAVFAILAWRARFSVAPDIWFMGFWLAFWTVGVATLLYRTYLSWALALSGSVLAWIGAVFMTLFSIPFLAGEIFVGSMLFRGAPGNLPAAAIAIGVANVLFYHLLERPTLKGRGVLNHLEGFRRYLGAAEEDVFDRLQPPDRSLELFERFLPFAIALDVSNRWAARFESVLTPGTGEAAASGTPTLSWYSGGSGGAFDLSGVTSSLGSSFSSSLSASSASPSGGGGGGGSSGGGGGGGGGGGW